MAAPTKQNKKQSRRIQFKNSKKQNTFELILNKIRPYSYRENILFETLEENVYFLKAASFYLIKYFPEKYNQLNYNESNTLEDLFHDVFSLLKDLDVIVVIDSQFTGTSNFSDIVSHKQIDFKDVAFLRNLNFEEALYDISLSSLDHFSEHPELQILFSHFIKSLYVDYFDSYLDHPKIIKKNKSQVFSTFDYNCFYRYFDTEYEPEDLEDLELKTDTENLIKEGIKYHKIYHQNIKKKLPDFSNKKYEDDILNKAKDLMLEAIEFCNKEHNFFKNFCYSNLGIPDTYHLFDKFFSISINYCEIEATEIEQYKQECFNEGYELPCEAIYFSENELKKYAENETYESLQNKLHTYCNFYYKYNSLIWNHFK